LAADRRRTSGLRLRQRSALVCRHPAIDPGRRGAPSPVA
jgi:hypothetical protein